MISRHCRDHERDRALRLIGWCGRVPLKVSGLGSVARL
jgi:hypothetical protein